MRFFKKIEKIWDDPVGCRVIAGGMLAIFSAIPSAIITYFSKPPNLRNNNNLLNIILSTKVELNLFIIINLSIFLISIIIFVILINKYKKYDLFISAPMSGLKDENEYKKFRNHCLEVKRTLETHCGFKKIYYAAEDKPEKSHFSTPRVAAVKDLKALKNSKKFLLIHPGRVYTSTFFEAGFAYRKQMRSLYFVKNLIELPFLMRHLADAASFVSIICEKSDQDFINTIKKDKIDIFTSCEESNIM